METYLIGLCERAHEIIPNFIIISIPIAIVLGIIYGIKTSCFIEDFASEFDYKIIKASKIGLIVCLIVFILSLLLLIFVPTGEEVRLMMQGN